MSSTTTPAQAEYASQALIDSAGLTTAALAGKVATLAAARLDQLNRLLEDGNWEAALNLINAVDSDAKAVSRSCTHLASKVNKRHWSPLLEQGQANA